MTSISEVFADGIRQNWISGIQNVGAPKYSSVADWLEFGGFSWLPINVPGVVQIDTTGDATSFAHALAAEASRFSCAAFESLIDASPLSATSKSFAWPAIRNYYAAFYCCHALLRISGISLTFLSSKTIAKLNKVAAQYLGISPNLNYGLHAIYPASKNSKILSLKHISGGGGSHEDLWGKFLEFLKETENTIIFTQAGNPQAIAATQLSVQLRAHLCKNGKANGAWFSAVRNSINYRQDYGVWYPYSIKKKSSDDLHRKINGWKIESANSFKIDANSGDLGELIDVSNFLARMLIATLQDIVKRSPNKSRCFADVAPFKLLRQRQISI